MYQYQKTYRGFKNKALKPKKKFKLLKLGAVFLFDIIFFSATIIKKILSLTLFKLLPISSKIFYNIVFKKILVPIYAKTRRLNKTQKKLLSPHNNKFFFLFSNRYVTHSVAVLIVLITILQNINIRELRAEEFGRDSLFAKISQGEILTEEIIEEEIIIPENITQGQNINKSESNPLSDLSPAIAPKIAVQKLKIQQKNSAALAQGGSAIIKPDLSETFDTPKPRESTIAYTVKPGDNIFNIAEEFRISINTILWANKLSSRSIIRPGDKLKILPVSGIEHTVSRNQTISSIAQKYNVPQKDILDINHLASNDTIQIGQKLIIPDGRPIYKAPSQPRRYVATTQSTASTTSSTASSSNLFWPTTCRRITQYFKGWRHTGIDIACGYGSNIYAAADGTIEKAGWNSGGYGNRIIVNHGNGLKTLYAHLKPQGILVSAGEYVKKGEIIGLMGTTGRSTGTHLHFEVIISGTRINPFNRL